MDILPDCRFGIIVSSDFTILFAITASTLRQQPGRKHADLEHDEKMRMTAYAWSGYSAV
jgi:hypothetical protein